MNIAGKQHILKFVQGLKLLLINGHPFRTEFGGMPMVVYVNQVKHYLRLTALPAGVKLNNVKLWNMEQNQTVQRNVSPTPNPSLKVDNSQASIQDESVKNTDSSSSLPTILNPPSPSALANDNSQEAFTAVAQSNAAFDRLINMIPTTPTNLGGGLKMPIHTLSETSVGGDGSSQNCSYTSTPIQDKSRPNWKKENTEQPSQTPETTGQGNAGNKPVDVHNLWAQLLGAGLVTTPSASANMAIPGLDSTLPDPNKTQCKSDVNEKEKKDLSDKGKISQKKGKEKTVDSKEEVKDEKKKIGPSHKEITLKSHHSSIKT